MALGMGRGHRTGVAFLKRPKLATERDPNGTGPWIGEEVGKMGDAVVGKTACYTTGTGEGGRN